MKRPEADETWIDYWDSAALFRPVMKSVAGHFCRQTESILLYNRHDVVLDYGCGPGYLIELLTENVGEIHGVDTSTKMIAECREKFRARDNVRFHLLDRGSYTDLSILGNTKFTVIVVLSVVQYFENILAVEQLLRSLCRVAAPGARLLVADVPVDDKPLLDTLELLRASLGKKFIVRALWFLLRSAASNYSRVRASRGLLSIPVPRLQEIVEKLSLEAEFISRPLTYNRRRAHLLITCGAREEGVC